MKGVIGCALLAIILIPSTLVCLELFWFAGRCPKGGPHAWGSNPKPHLSYPGSPWVQCSKCGMEDY